MQEDFMQPQPFNKSPEGEMATKAEARHKNPCYSQYAVQKSDDGIYLLDLA